MITLLNWTWGIVQTLLGLIIVVLTYGRFDRSESYKGVCVVYLKRTRWGVALGHFVIISNRYNRRTRDHEYGHCRQSAMLGPLYLIIVGLISIIRASVWAIWQLPAWKYYRGYPEKWADKLGGVLR